MFSFETSYRVIYGDVDQMGYMYYGNYARLYEIGRVEALRSLGLIYKDFEDNGIWMPVYENYSKYVKPAKYDDLIKIKVIIGELPEIRIGFKYELYNSKNELIHHGNTTLFFLNSSTEKIVKCPESILKALEPYF